MSSVPPPPTPIPNDFDPLQPFLETPSSPGSTEPASPWQVWQQEWDAGVRPHLEELRWRLWGCLLAITLGGLGGWSIAPGAIGALQHLAPAHTQFVQIAPGESFLVVVKMALVVGLTLASPVVLYQFVRFLVPGLTPIERRWLLALVVGGTGLFAGGLALAWWVLLPTALSWLLAFGQGLVTPQISLATYVDTCLTLLALTGLMAELPLVLLILLGLRWVTTDQLMTRWREGIIAVLVLGALITPTWDPLTLCLISLPVVVLLAVTVWLARWLRW